MKWKISCLAIVIVFMIAFTLFMQSMPVTLSTPSTQTISFVSDLTDMCWYGATVANNQSGYIVPPSDPTKWSPAVWAWCPLDGTGKVWNDNLSPTSSRDLLFTDPKADWIWKNTTSGPFTITYPADYPYPQNNPKYKVTDGQSYTGDIVFFKKMIEIPSDVFNIQVQLFITADNAYYFYVNKPSWSGTPDGIANFIAGYNPTNFYYASDGKNNLGGGYNSVPYEKVGNLYPKYAAIDLSIGAWASIEVWDITSKLNVGSNLLQIVAIEGRWPPPNNPAGLIYKVKVTYQYPRVEKTLSPDHGTLGDVINVTLNVEVPTGLTMTVEDVLPSCLKYIPGTFTVNDASVTPTVTDGNISTTLGGGDHVVKFNAQIIQVEATAVTSTNWVYLKDATGKVLAEDSANITVYPYCGFHKLAILRLAGCHNPDVIEVNEKVIWTLTISVTNLYDWNMTEVVVTDHLAAEIRLNITTYITPGTTLVWQKNGATKLTWTIGSLEPGETATLELWLFSYGYGEPGRYELNSGAVLKFINPTTGFLHSAHTRPIKFDVLTP